MKLQEQEKGTWKPYFSHFDPTAAGVGASYVSLLWGVTKRFFYLSAFWQLSNVVKVG